MKDMLVYIDSNVFILTGSEREQAGDDSRRLIKGIIQGKCKGITASLTFDEVFYQLSRIKSRNTATVFCENFLALPNLEFLSVDATVLGEALGLLKKHSNLDPRDAIHASVALSRKTDLFITDDHGFSKILGLNTVTVKEALSKLGNPL